MSIHKSIPAKNMQEWAIRKDQRDHQRQTGTIAMMKGEAERTRTEDLPSRVLTRRDTQDQSV